MIRGVTFDWWNTIAATPSPDYNDVMRRLRLERTLAVLRGAGIAVESDALYRAYDRHGDVLAEAFSRNVDLPAEEQVRLFLGFADLDGQGPQVSRLVSDAFGGALLVKPPILFPHIAETLRGLRKEGYAIGLVSNTGRTWGRYLRHVQEALGIGSYFDARIFSDEQGFRKPDRRIFEAALRDLRLPASDVVHVGDDAIADLAGAKAVGMRAVWFDPGFRPDARPDEADAEVHDHGELPAVLARWWR